MVDPEPKVYNSIKQMVISLKMSLFSNSNYQIPGILQLGQANNVEP